MADYDRRREHGGGGGGGYNSKKRRYREDDEHDRGGRGGGNHYQPSIHQQNNNHYHGGGDRDRGYHDNRRRRFDAPLPVRIRRQTLALADSPLRRWSEEVSALAGLILALYTEAEAERAEEERRERERREEGDKEDGASAAGAAEGKPAKRVAGAPFIELALQVAVEQPLKTPFVAAAALVANATRPEAGADLVKALADGLQEKLREGCWRDVKLYLRLLACLQGIIEGDGLFPLLEQLFERAVGLQTEDSADSIGTEIIKIILVTLPYMMATGPARWEQKATELLDRTDIIASEPHVLQSLFDPYQAVKGEKSPTANMSFIGLLQKQLQQEAGNGWPLACLPRPWQLPLEEIEQQEKMDNAEKHSLPAITVPENLLAGSRALFPEIYFSVYLDQDIQSVPSVGDIASTLIRDALLDTINVLAFNRNVTARYLIDLDCYFADGTFIKRATPFDRLKDMEEGRPTWKPEDIAVDAVFSQLLQLPQPEHKLVYYHSVLTEACKLAPAAIAPSLGRAIRFLYLNSYHLDLELSFRFLDWFTHHLSNFGFTWKWTEWVEDVKLPSIHPYKAFIIGAIDKEIRLSFAQRIKNTLPEPYQGLIGSEMEKDTPDFRFNNEDVLFSQQGRELAGLLRRKAPDADLVPVMESVIELARADPDESGIDPSVAAVDVFVTAVCYVGSKSMSHVLACIERTQERLLEMASASDAARVAVVRAVATYWSAHPGVAISIVEKLLNYAILTPAAVVEWALAGGADVDTATKADADGGEEPAAAGAALARTHVYEMVFSTVVKVTGRVRQMLLTPTPPDVDAEAADESRNRAVADMRDLFRMLEDRLEALGGVVNPVDDDDDDMEMKAGESTGAATAAARASANTPRWASRWLRVFRRHAAVEEAFVKEAEARRREKEAEEAQKAAEVAETAADEMDVESGQ